MKTGNVEERMLAEVALAMIVWKLMDKTLAFSPLGGIMLRHGLQYLLKFPSKVELQQS